MSTTITPQIVTEDDTARTRRTDPISSHRAGDRSQKNLRATKLAVLTLIHDTGYLSGEEINDMYSIRSGTSGWPALKVESPRKRAGELFDAGYLMDTADDGDPCRVYCLTPRGLNAIGADA